MVDSGTLMVDPRISVVIPTYNRSRFLVWAIQSVREQTLPAAEIIVVDDGSTDDTERVVRELGDDIVYLKQANAGPGAARNRGIAHAGGYFVAFLDTDDIWLPAKLEQQLQLFQAHPELGLVCADMRIVDEAGAVLVDSNFRKRGLLPMFTELAGAPVPEATRKLFQINFINTSTVVIRRDVFDTVGLFNPGIRYGEDLELWLRIAARYPIACLPQVLEVRGEHAANVTKSQEPMLKSYVTLAEAVREWGRDVMMRAGVSPDRYVANCWSDLGYWYFSRQRHVDARWAFGRSLREAFTLRAAFYAGCSMLPPAVTGPLRSLKQRVRA